MDAMMTTYMMMRGMVLVLNYVTRRSSTVSNSYSFYKTKELRVKDEG